MVSLPFLGLLLHFFENSNLSFIKNATTELYQNLSYMSLSGARDFEFLAVSDLIAHLSFLIKKATVENQKMRDIESQVLAKILSNDEIFEPKIQDPLDDVIEIHGKPNPEHKKTMFPYVEPTVQLPDEIEDTQKLIDDDFIDFQTQFDKVNNVATEQKKQKKIEDVIDTAIDDKNPFNNYDDFWWEEDVFSKKDPPATIEATKNIVDDIQAISDNILRNIRPVNSRTVEELIDDDFIPIDNRTQQELEDDDFASIKGDSDIENKVKIESDFESESETEEIVDEPVPESVVEEIDTTSAWDSEKTQITRPGPVIRLSTDYNKKVKTAKKNRKQISKKNNWSEKQKKTKPLKTG